MLFKQKCYFLILEPEKGIGKLLNPIVMLKFNQKFTTVIKYAFFRKLLINIALFGVGIYLSASFKDLTFEAPPLPQQGP